MPFVTVLKRLARAFRADPGKLLRPMPDNARSRIGVYKTRDLRMDVHQDSKDKNKAVAYILANHDAKDLAVMNWVRSDNKGSGNRKGNGKIFKKLRFYRHNFNVEAFAQRIERCWRK